MPEPETSQPETTERIARPEPQDSVALVEETQSLVGAAESSAGAAPTEPAATPGQAARSIWQLPFCSGVTTWLHVTNTICYLVLYCLHVLVYSEAVWPSVQKKDNAYGPIVTPSGWAYYIQDLAMFLWGLAIASQNLVESTGWKEVLIATIGPSWQVIWYGECVWLVLYVSAGAGGLALAPLFTLAALVAALSTHTRVAWALPPLHAQLQEEGFAGVPALGYLLFVFPTSISVGWLLVLHCHATTVAVQVLSGSEQAATLAGCVCLVLAAVLALVLLLRRRDVVLGLAFTWGAASIWIAGFTTNDDYRPDQLVAFFCGLVIGLMSYCIVAGPAPSPPPAGGAMA